MDITNDAMLTQVINSIALIAITNVSNKILNLLQNKILEETYGSHGQINIISEEQASHQKNF